MHESPRRREENKAPDDLMFRYPLARERRDESLYRTRPVELVRSALESLLNLVVLQHSGADVEIDSFRWLNATAAAYHIFAEPGGVQCEEADSSPHGLDDGFKSAKNAAFYEPRIDLIKKLAESLLDLVEFESEGKVVKVDGFRLKDLQDWLAPSPADPAEVFDYAATRCPCDCVFCCNKGNPPSLAGTHAPVRIAAEEMREMETRLEYFSPQAKTALFPSAGTICDAMAHPHFLDILRRLREKADKPFRITTNGNMLSSGAIETLAGLKPVYLYVSLNSSSPVRRKKLMNDRKPQVAIASLPLLRQAQIPYAAVIVPWPLDTKEEMLTDLVSTAEFAATSGAHIIQVNLPGFSRFFSPAAPFDTAEIWPPIVDCVRRLRETQNTPIVVMPALYEENLCQPRKNLPLVTGVVRNSPACLAGMARGDLILQVEGIPVHDRPQARDLFAAVKGGRAAITAIRVRRKGKEMEFKLDLRQGAYPYYADIDDYLGIIFAGAGLRPSSLERLKEIIDRRHAARVLFLSSQLMRPTFEQCLAESRLFNSRVRIDIDVPENMFFGGNIIMGDLLVVQDFIDCINGHLKNGDRPDLVVIPSSPFNLSGWGRDLTGRVYLDIERQTGVPVELLPCDTIYS